MTISAFYSVVGLALFLLGFYSFFARRTVLKKILSLNVASSGLFLLMISTAFGNSPGRPDPILHALVLTGIVIAVSTTAFALALSSRLRPPTDGEDDGDKPPEAVS